MAHIEPILPKIAPLIRMMGSANDGEALGSVRAIGRVLASVDADFNDLVEHLEREGSRPGSTRPATLSTSQIRTILEHAIARRFFSPWENEFAGSVLRTLDREQRWRATPRQQGVLDRLISKATQAGVRA